MTDAPVLIFDETDGAPRSVRFDDIYYMPGQGRQETRYVFIDGTLIPQRISSHTGTFTVFETGFGTGLNFCETVAAFSEYANAPALHYMSVEKFPIAAADAVKALRASGADEDAVILCEEAYNRAAAGETDITVSHKTVTLQLLIGDIADIAGRIDGGVVFNAVYLDGFAPAKNPEMWAPPLFAFLRDHAKPQHTICATFTAAGAVRRALDDAGFTVTRIPGFGRKRHMTRAIF